MKVDGAVITRRTGILAVLVGLMSLWSPPAPAQSPVGGAISTRDSLKQVLPPEVVTKLAEATSQKVFAVSGTERFRGQVLQADQIVFGDGGHLVLESIDAPWIVIASRQLKFQNPENYSKISFAPRAPLLGEDGRPGRAGSGGTGDGGNGGAGGAGLSGRSGGSPVLPKLYIVVDQVLSPTGEPPAVNLAIMGNGGDGGPGGNGGRGGPGGNGARGRTASDGPFHCKRGGQPAGNGGAGGQGGRGGDGGAGGRGVDLVIAASPKAIEALSFVRVYNAGGFGGTPGSPGSPGQGGSGGAGGNGSRFCSGGPRGSNGGSPSPANLGKGSQGVEGTKGQFELLTVTDVSIGIR